MKQFLIKNWRHLAITSGLFVCLFLGSYLAFPASTIPTPRTDVLKTASTHASNPKVAAATNTTPAVSSNQLNADQATASSTTQNTPQPASSTAPSPSATSTTPAQSPANTQVTSVTVTLQVDSKTVGDVNVAATANQCDVLTDALAQGIISSLDMRYFSSLSSYGVYVINGQGDSNQVWWVYSVNGKSPPVGCSKLGVSGGEIINWQYTGK